MITLGILRVLSSRHRSEFIESSYPPQACARLQQSLQSNPIQSIMVQAKHKKSRPKPKKHPTPVKKHGKQADRAQFRSQLEALGLKIIEVTADGNCLFRALADQLEGNEQEHQKYRHMVVQYILNHREEFEPFIEDDVPFDDYCQSMEKDGTWAGNMELQAASLVTQRNICIHRIRSPRWYISNFSSHESNMIHLCYHDGEHYNSVRVMEDSCEGPAKPIIIKVDANLSTSDHNKKVTANELKRSSRKCLWDIESIKQVMTGTGCESVDKIEQVLREVNGDVDAAVEFLIAEQEVNGSVDYNDDILSAENGDDQNWSSGLAEVASGDAAYQHSESRNSFQSVRSDSISSDDKDIPRNRECPCGSRKKYKACCGSAAVKSSQAHAMYSLLTLLYLCIFRRVQC